MQYYLMKVTLQVFAPITVTWGGRGVWRRRQPSVITHNRYILITLILLYALTSNSGTT